MGNNIANNGATFQGKSAMGNMGCVQNMTGAVMVAKPPLEAQLDSVDEILPGIDRIYVEEYRALADLLFQLVANR